MSELYGGKTVYVLLTEPTNHLQAKVLAEREDGIIINTFISYKELSCILRPDMGGYFMEHCENYFKTLKR